MILKERTIRTPLDPDITFSDDPLRMMRCIRFATQLNFYIDDETFEALSRNKERIHIISKERIADELNKILLAPIPSKGFIELDRCGLLPLIFPEFSALQGVDVKNGRAHKDNFYHTLEVVDNISKHTDNLWLRWATLLHDIGKYVSLRSHSLYSYMLIMSCDILGFSEMDKKIVALASYYHAHRLFSGKRHAEVEEMSPEIMPLVAKIAALVRLADAMDRSYKQKIKSCRVNVKNGVMKVEAVTLEDLTIEEWTFASKASFFEEVYGLQAVLERVDR